MSKRKSEDLERRFTYHPPLPGQPERYTAIREAALQFALLIEHMTPVSREQSTAFTHLETVVFWANAAIARNEKPPVPETQACVKCTYDRGVKTQLCPECRASLEILAARQDETLRNKA